MKKLLLILTVAAIIFALYGCTGSDPIVSETPPESSAESKTDSQPEPFEMKKVGYSSDNRFEYYVDVVTDVLYVWNSDTGTSIYGYGIGGGLTVMLDPESGLPLTYTRYMELYNNAGAKGIGDFD